MADQKQSDQYDGPDEPDATLAASGLVEEGRTEGSAATCPLAAAHVATEAAIGRLRACASDDTAAMAVALLAVYRVAWRQEQLESTHPPFHEAREASRRWRERVVEAAYCEAREAWAQANAPALVWTAPDGAEIQVPSAELEINPILDTWEHLQGEVCRVGHSIHAAQLRANEASHDRVWQNCCTIFLAAIGAPAPLGSGSDVNCAARYVRHMLCRDVAGYAYDPYEWRWCATQAPWGWRLRDPSATPCFNLDVDSYRERRYDPLLLGMEDFPHVTHITWAEAIRRRVAARCIGRAWLGAMQRLGLPAPTMSIAFARRLLDPIVVRIQSAWRSLRVRRRVRRAQRADFAEVARAVASLVAEVERLAGAPAVAPRRRRRKRGGRRRGGGGASASALAGPVAAVADPPVGLLREGAEAAAGVVGREAGDAQSLCGSEGSLPTVDEAEGEEFAAGSGHGSASEGEGAGPW